MAIHAAADGCSSQLVHLHDVPTLGPMPRAAFGIGQVYLAADTRVASAGCRNSSGVGSGLWTAHMLPRSRNRRREGDTTSVPSQRGRLDRLRHLHTMSIPCAGRICSRAGTGHAAGNELGKELLFVHSCHPPSSVPRSCCSGLPVGVSHVGSIVDVPTLMIRWTCRDGPTVSALSCDTPRNPHRR